MATILEAANGRVGQTATSAAKVGPMAWRFPYQEHYGSLGNASGGGGDYETT
jgi:hypothetical protein